MATEVLVATETPSSQALPRTECSCDADTRRSRLELGGVLVDQVDLPGATERIQQFVLSDQPHQVVTVNLDFLSTARRDPAFRTTLNMADLAVPDGMPLVWVSRLKGQPLTERVPGVELVTATCRIAAEHGRTVFLLGARPGVADAAGRKLQALYPGLRIAGTYSPSIGPFKREEHEHIIRMIQAASPDVLFVALGAPRQDLWIRQHQPTLQVPVAMGVGCVFDLLAGSVRRAPAWMQRMGLEWAFRLLREPQRLWRRYLVDDIPMLARLLWGGRHADQAETLATVTP